MKKSSILTVCAALILPAIMFPLVASGAPAQENAADFRDVMGKEWILAELRSGGRTVTFDRYKLIADNLGGVFTISFNENQASGMGAPNRYHGPYTSGSSTLSIGNLASTMMLAFKEPDGLSEKEYFDYLTRVTRWYLRAGKLELYSADSSGREAVLIFGIK